MFLFFRAEILPKWKKIVAGQKEEINSDKMIKFLVVLTFWDARIILAAASDRSTAAPVENRVFREKDAQVREVGLMHRSPFYRLNLRSATRQRFLRAEALKRGFQSSGALLFPDFLCAK